jgi:hypothetical protein
MRPNYAPLLDVSGLSREPTVSEDTERTGLSAYGALDRVWDSSTAPKSEIAAGTVLWV